MLIGRTFLLLLLFVNLKALSQNDPDSIYARSIEGYFMPALGFNHLSVGYTVLKPRGVETIVVGACNVYFHMGTSINLNITANRNHYLKGRAFYIPVWVRISNTRRTVGYEEGYFPHTLRFSIGSGIGDVVKISKKLFLRTEIGLGVSLNMTNGRGNEWPFKFDYSNYEVDDDLPVLPALRLRLSFLKPLRRRSI